MEAITIIRMALTTNRCSTAARSFTWHRQCNWPDDPGPIKRMHEMIAMKRCLFLLLPLAAATLVFVRAGAQEQFPIMDKVAAKVIQKYQQSSCPQLMAQRDQPKSPEEQRALQLLRGDPNMRRAFINRVAGPIANKMFECGMIPYMFAESFNQALSDPSLIACPHCDLLQRLPNLASATSARCPRCNHELWRRREDSLNRTTALAAAAAVLYIIANTVPMLGLTVVGREASTTIIGGAEHLWQDEQMTVAVLVLFTAVLAPAMQIIVMLAILLGTRRQPVPSWVDTLLHHHGATQTWSMVEVMLLGVLVALVKIADYATVIPGTALFVLGALIVVLAAMQASFEPHEVWERIQWAQPPERGGELDDGIARAELVRAGSLTAMQEGLQSCETCELLSHPARRQEKGTCPRCGEALEFRKRASIQRAWAFLIAAAICYIPANVLPVLTT